MLHNGYHRACAIRAMGVTHAPCVITPVDTQDELEVIAKSAVAKSPELYFKSHRPPLLRDYFDPKIRKSLISTSWCDHRGELQGERVRGASVSMPARHEWTPLFREEALAERRSQWLGTVLLVPRISQTVLTVSVRPLQRRSCDALVRFVYPNGAHRWVAGAAGGPGAGVHATGRYRHRRQGTRRDTVAAAIRCSSCRRKCRAQPAAQHRSRLRGCSPIAVPACRPP